MASLRVVLADDNYLVREGVRLLMESEPDLDLLASCSDLDELLAAVDEHDPDVVVTDIRMPPTGTNEGIEAAERLRSSHPSVGVVVLSQYADPEYAVQLFASGSGGRAYLLKERVADLDQLLHALREVAAGRSVMDPQIVDALVAERGQSSLLERLTPRETEVLALLAKGRNNAGIAQELVLTERAVEKHVSSIFAKLDLAPDEATVHRRVAATLIFLAEQRVAGPAPSGRRG